MIPLTLLVATAMLFLVAAVVNIKDHDDISTRAIAYIATGVICFVISAFLLLQILRFSVKGDIGQIGDFIGGIINPIFSLITILILIKTLKLQKKDSRKAEGIYQKQLSALELERFESTFFKLLDYFHTCCEAHTRVEADDHGRTKAYYIREDLLDFDPSNCKSYLQEARLAKRHIREIYRSDHNKNRRFTHCGLTVLSFILTSSIDIERKKLYLRIFIDSLHPHEFPIFLNFAYGDGLRARQVIRTLNAAKDVTNTSFPSFHIKAHLTRGRSIFKHTNPAR